MSAYECSSGDIEIDIKFVFLCGGFVRKRADYTLPDTDHPCEGDLSAKTMAAPAREAYCHIPMTILNECVMGRAAVPLCGMNIHFRCYFHYRM